MAGKFKVLETIIISRQAIVLIIEGSTTIPKGSKFIKLKRFISFKEKDIVYSVKISRKRR